MRGTSMSTTSTRGSATNGVGTAFYAVVDRPHSAVEDDLKTALRLVPLGCEETGVVSSHHCADTHGTNDFCVIVDTDGAGYGRTLRVSDQWFGAIRRAAEAVSIYLSGPC